MAFRALGLAAACLIQLSATAPLSDRVVAYRIDARFDAAAHTVEGTEVLTYTNRTGQPLDRFPFHLYLNAFQPKSTWIREAHRDGNRNFGEQTGWNARKAGAQEIRSLQVDGMGDLKDRLRFIAPDDGNPDDRTVCEVALPKPVPPGASITFRIGFKATFPEVVMRTGYKRDFLLAGQWFPKVGVWWKGAWNCHQFHASTEFFSDYGTYDVNLTLPATHAFGSTGVVTHEKLNGDGTKTVQVRAEDVHDFAWTASPRYVVIRDEVQLPSGPKQIRLLMQPGREASIPRYLGALKGTMRKFEEWIGPYPYPQITVVDPPHGAGAAGGMEYPMFITAGTSWLMPRGLHEPEMVTEHEYGHQYWYGMVGSNEFENAWLDEGLNTYLEVKVMDALYGADRGMLDLPFAKLGDRHLQRLSYAFKPDFDPLTRHAWKYVNGASYGGISYGKGATMLLTLEHLVGEAKVMEALRAFFLRYRFQHPTEEDFFASMNASLGQDLGWFWDQAARGTQRLDYRISKAHSLRTEWQDAGRTKGKLFTTEVVVHRAGDFVFPVTLVATFDNGEVKRETWDGKERWRRWEWTSQARLVSAQVNPEGGILLDLDRFNDSRVVKADPRAARKIGNAWTVLVQWATQLLGWLV